jgi:hypothetical protein
MKNFIYYILPLVTILLIGSILFLDPEITGFAVFENEEILITLNTYEDFILPENSVLEVVVGNISDDIIVKDFIEKSGQNYISIKGKNRDLGFNGQGYTGNNTYYLSINEFNFNNKDYVEELVVNVYYEDFLISTQNIILNKNLYK